MMSMYSPEYFIFQLFEDANVLRAPAGQYGTFHFA